jgi:Holliday junction DNA helicase RuvA
VISTLRGLVQHIRPGEVVIDVGGVGLTVAVPASALPSSVSVGQVVFLYTRLIVREDSLSLYGFESAEQRELFDTLLQVNGVGPRVALAVLSHLSPEALRGAVAGNHPEILSKVPGIGRKTAEKIIFHLHDRIAPLTTATPILMEADRDVLSVLTALGYSMVEAQSAIQSLPADAPDAPEERVRIALRYFAER